jgi:hypothetical protein
MSDRMKVVCDCGCGGKAYHSQMVTIETEQAIDKDLRKTGTTKRFWVLPKCREPFERELALTVMVQTMSKAWAPPPVTRWWLLNAWFNPLYPWPKHLINWIRRLNAARQVMKMQHAIWERTRGFEYAKVHATNSAILFGAPRFMQGFLARRFTKRLRAAKEKSAGGKDAVPQEAVPVRSLD